MKLYSILFVCFTILIASCAQDSDNSSSSNDSGINTTSTNTAPVASEPVTPDPAIAGQPPVNENSPQPVSPTLPGNLRQAAQQNAINQQLNIQPLNQQQQQQQAAPAPIKTIGDEKTAHFICPNACKGSGADAAANCPVCGSGYTHNAESPWHAANPTTPQATPAPQPGQPTPAAVQPIQNTNPLPAGDHTNSHYICPDKCVGSGSLNPGKCPVCAKEYVHNAESEAHKEETRRREQQQN